MTHTHTQTPTVLINRFLHVRFVVVTNLLDPDVVLGFDKRLCCCVRLGESHHAGDVLEVSRILHLYLPSQRNRVVFSYLTYTTRSQQGSWNAN